MAIRQAVWDKHLQSPAMDGALRRASVVVGPCGFLYGGRKQELSVRVCPALQGAFVDSEVR